MTRITEVKALTRLEGTRSWCRYCLRYHVRYHVLWIFKTRGDGWHSLSLSYSRQDGGEKMTLGVEVSAVEWWQGSRRRTRRYGLTDLPWSIMNEWCISNAPFFAMLFRDSVGGTWSRANPLVQTMPRGEKRGLYERICMKASMAWALLGGMELQMHADWRGEGGVTAFPAPTFWHRLSAR